MYIVAGENVRATRAEIRESSTRKSANHVSIKMRAVFSVFSRFLFFVELTSYSRQYTIFKGHHHEQSIKPDSKSSQQFELAPTSQISII
jgi:hypothetical protein